MSQKSPSGTPNHSDKRRSTRTVLLWCIGVVVILLLGLPSILSTGVARRAMLKKLNVNRSLPVTVADWSFGWFSGQHLDGISFSNGQGLDVTIASVSVSRGLAALLIRRDWGELVVREPLIRLNVQAAMPPAPADPEGSPVPGPTDSPGRTEPESPSEPARIPFDVAGSIRVERGICEVVAESGTQRFDPIELDMTITSLNAPVKLTAAVTQSGGGRLDLDGTVVLFRDGVLDPAALAADIRLEIARLDVTPVATLAGTFTPLPQVGGIVDTTLSLKLTGISEMDLSLQSTVTNLVLSGDPFGSDKPAYDSVRLTADIHRSGHQVDIKALSFTAPFATITGTGNLEDSGGQFPEGSLQIRGSLDLARLATDFPATLQMKPDISVRRGLLGFQAEIQSVVTSMTASIRADLPNVEAMRGNEKILMDQPIRLSTAISVSESGPRVDQLNLQSGFATVSGQGDLKDFTASMDVDLTAALVEAKKFIHVGALDAGGKLSMSLRVSQPNDSEKIHEIGAAIKGVDVQVDGLTPKPLRIGDVSADGSARIQFADAGTVESIQDLRLAAQAMGMTLQATCMKLVPGKTVDPMLMPGQTTVRLRADEIRGTVEVDLTAVVLRLRQCGLITLPGQASLEGALTVDLAGQMGDAIDFTAELQGRNLVWMREGRRLEESTASVRLSGLFSPGPDTLHLKELDLRTAPLTVQASGSVQQLLTTRDVQASGSLECDFAAVARWIEAITGTRIVMEGKRPDTFSVSLKLGEPEWRARVLTLKAGAALYLERLTAFGMNLEQFNMSLNASGGLLTLPVRTTVNGGTLTFSPTLDVTGERAMLQLPPDSRVLNGVKLTDALASELLGLIHPAFRGSTVLAGDVGFVLSRFEVPLDAGMKQDMEIAGTLELSETTITPAGLLAALLDVAQLEHKPVHLPAQTVSFTCRNGRVETSPMVFTHDEYRLTMVGVVGLDGSLLYTVELPVTRKMVGREVYEYVKDTPLSLSIEGTVTQPRFSTDALKKTLAELATRAATKAIEKKGGDMLKDLGDSLLKDLDRKRGR